MSNFFVDTSALAKRYLSEPASKWVVSWIEPQAGNVIFVSELVLVELRSLFARHVRDGMLTSANKAILQANFEAHLIKGYIVIPLNTFILESAAALTDKYQLRALDAIHRASALLAVKEIGVSMTFISGDKNQLLAAASEGFATDNPYLHV